MPGELSAVFKGLAKDATQSASKIARSVATITEQAAEREEANIATIVENEAKTAQTFTSIAEPKVPQENLRPQSNDGVGTDRGDGRDALGRFTGTGGYGASAEAEGLANYEVLTGRSVIDDQVRATLPDGTTRYYDGLSRNADGTYQGVEVKSGTAGKDLSQRTFDKQVDSGTPATATLHGKKIVINSTYEIRVP